jgi:hypothetical protein
LTGGQEPPSRKLPRATDKLRIILDELNVDKEFEENNNEGQPDDVG